MSELTVLGIDPGTSNIGLAVIRRDITGKWSLLHSPILKSVDDFMEQLVTVPASYQLNAIACEAVGTSGAWKSKTQGNGSGGIVGCEWACRLLAATKKVPLSLVAPSSWRLLLTGSGKATHKQVHQVIRLMVQGVPAVCSEHRLEAMAIAIAGVRKLGI